MNFQEYTDKLQKIKEIPYILHNNTPITDCPYGQGFKVGSSKCQMCEANQGTMYDLVYCCPANVSETPESDALVSALRAHVQAIETTIAMRSGETKKNTLRRKHVHHLCRAIMEIEKVNI